MSDGAWEVAYFDLALLACGGDSGGRCHSCGKIQYWGGRYFGVDERFALGHGAREAIPTAVNVGEYLCIGDRVTLRLCGEAFREEADREYDGDAAPEDRGSFLTSHIA